MLPSTVIGSIQASSSSTFSAATTLYTGNHGEEFVNFLQRAQREQFTLELKHPTVTWDFNKRLQVLLSHVQLYSNAEAVISQYVQDFEPLRQQVALGYYPQAELPLAVEEYIRTVHPQVSDFSAFMQLESAVISSIENAVRREAQDDNNPNPTAYLVARRNRVPRQAPDAALILPPTVTVGATDYTASTALFQLFLTALTLTFKYADQGAVQAVLKMGTAGTQGPRTLIAWLRDVMRAFAFTRHLSELQSTAPVQVFLGGLNSAELRRCGFTIRQVDDTITLEGLCKKLMKLEAELQQGSLTITQASIYGVTGLPSILGGESSSSSSSSRPIMPAANMFSGSSSSTQPGSGSEYTYSKLYPDHMVAQWLQRETPSKQQQLLEGLKLAQSNPNAEGAICRLAAHGISSHVRPHLNKDCQVQIKERNKLLQEAQHSSSSSSNQQQQELTQLLQNLTLNQPARQGMAGQVPPWHGDGQQRSSSTTLNSSVAMQLATALLAQGIPQNVPKSALPPTSKGGYRSTGAPQQQYQQQRQRPSSGPCELCGFADGHPDDICYCEYPEAPEQRDPPIHNWGPHGSTKLVGVLTYVLRCKEQQRTPNLSHARRQVRDLLADPRLPNDVKQFIRQHTGQQPPSKSGLGPVAMLANAMLQAPQQQPPVVTGQHQQHMAAAAQQQPFGAPPGLVASSSRTAAFQLPSLDFTGQSPTTQAGASSNGFAAPPDAAPNSGAYYFSAAIAVPPGYQCLPRQDSDPWLAAAAQTRMQKAKLHELASFVPRPALPADPNTAAGGRDQGAAARDGEQEPQPHSADSNSPACTKPAEDCVLSDATILKAVEALQAALLQKIAARDPVKTAAMSSSLAATLAGDSESAAATAGSSGPSCSSTGGRIVNAAQALNIRPQFPVRTFDYDAYMRRRTKLIHIRDTPPGQPAHVMLHLHNGRSRPIPVSGAAIDNGCNECALTEAFCDANGIRWERSPMPLLLQSDGESRPALIGRTEPLTIALGEYSGKPMVITKPQGIAVMKGDAAGMYALCLDTESVKANFGHVNPLFEHFIWYPDAPDDVSTVNGVPVETAYPEATFMPAVNSKVGIAGQVMPQVHKVCAVAQVLPAACGHACSNEQQHPLAAVQQPQQVAAEGDAAASCSSAATTQQQDTKKQQHATASSRTSRTGWRSALRLAPWLCMQLLISCWQFFIRLPLACLPGRAFAQLVDAANLPVLATYRRVVSRPRYHPAQQATTMPKPPSDHQLPPSSRKRRQGDPNYKRWVRFERKLRWKQVGGTAPAGSRRHPARFLARICLMLLLIAACCVASTSAMQAGSLWQVSAALTAGAQVLGLQPNMQQQAAQQAIKMLGHELGGLQRNCFRCYCPIPWL